MSNLYERALAAFVDRYLGEHPDADEFEAERMFDENPDNLALYIADQTDRTWQRQKDDRYENV